ncbi:hypothetical protein U9M48_043820 [Paspalum notatum var. saurae]|uniref:Uncharacterized protein n=1 Tax=Paspalum notatum var. saurae TaxID=547442 RepID=A0AAQ3V012_PASNO
MEAALPLPPPPPLLCLSLLQRGDATLRSSAPPGGCNGHRSRALFAARRVVLMLSGAVAAEVRAAVRRMQVGALPLPALASSHKRRQLVA